MCCSTRRVLAVSIFTSKCLSMPAETYVVNEKISIVAAMCLRDDVRYVFSTGLASVALKPTKKRRKSHQRYPLITRNIFLVLSVALFDYRHDEVTGQSASPSLLHSSELHMCVSMNAQADDRAKLHLLSRLPCITMSQPHSQIQRGCRTVVEHISICAQSSK